MKKLIPIISMLLAIVSCEKTTPNSQNTRTVPAPEIVLSASEVIVPAKGGVAEMGYELTSPVKNASIALKSSESWLTELSAVDGKIKFNASANESNEVRYATVTLEYPELTKAPSFIVQQEAAARKDFVIALSEATTSSFVLTLTPADNNMDYFYHVIPTATAAEFNDDDALYRYDISFYEDMDSSTGLGWQAWAVEDLKKGPIAELKIESMKPDTEYLVYAYGVNAEFERITPIERQTIKTLKPETLNVNFSIEILSEDSAEAKARITAENYDGYFVGKIFSNIKEGDTDETVIQKINEYWEGEVQMAGWIGYTPEQLLSMHASKNTAEPVKTVEKGQVCYVYAFAVDNNAMRCSDIIIKKFTAK